jgi:hypothetical protein
MSTLEISLLIVLTCFASGVTIIGAVWLLLSRERPHDPTLDRITNYQPPRYQPIIDDVCRCYLCERIAADRLTPRNS